jgi:hypothetical protein
MQKLAITITIIALFSVCSPISAQGLTIENIKPKARTSIERKEGKVFMPQLNLPKPNNPLVKVVQNGFLSQHNYPQAYLHKNHSNHYQFLDRQLLATQNQKDLFVDRLVDAALSKLFNWD